MQAKLARSSKRERVLLKTMWNGFVGAVQGGSEEQATQMRDAHRYIQHEKARCEALMREAERFGPVEAPDAEEQVHSRAHTRCAVPRLLNGDDVLYRQFERSKTSTRCGEPFPGLRT